MDSYDFQKIESKWQKIWEEEGYGQSKDFDSKPKHYNLVEFPYPSGAGLHVGHCMGYGASDAYCRMKRMQGFNVMYPMGWDAFGLPTENYAIKNKVKPSEVTKESIATFKKQMKMLGYSFDWSRELDTTDPAYYKWTQWIFLQFYRHGYKDGRIVEIDDTDTTTPRLAYQAEMPINWCPSCKIGLANEEVIAGACERCGTAVVKKTQKQWMLRITSYADRLIKDLETVNYEERIKTQQVNWIGRSEGLEEDWKVDGMDLTLKTFTTWPHTSWGSAFMVVAPEHPVIDKLIEGLDNENEIREFLKKTIDKKIKDPLNVEKDKEGIFLGRYVINHLTGKKMPLWAANFAIYDYGTGIVKCTGAHDERDFEFARKYNLEIIPVITPVGKEPLDAAKMTEAYTGEGTMVNAGQFNGLPTKEARKAIGDYTVEHGDGRWTVNYKLRDWVFSRQHYWGEPIPIVHCQKCGTVPLSDKDLPLELPNVENYEPSNTGESPLATISDWVNTTCPKCGGKARRETDTMPNWAGSSWYFLRYCDPENAEKFAERKKLDYWMPVDLYNGGMEHTTLHLLYSRFWHKFLFDLGLVPNAEPYQKRIAHGIILGPDRQKMSKSRGNVINPDEMVAQFGADTLRAYIMFIGPYDQESAWSMNGIKGVFRFLNRVWQNAEKVNDVSDPDELLIKLNQTIAGVTNDLETYQLNTVVSKLMEFNNTIEKIGKISATSWQKFLTILFPACPHIAEELWEKSGFEKHITDQSWPKADGKYMIAEKVTVAVQVNGKLRDTIQIAADAQQNEAEATAKAGKIKELIIDKKILKTIYVAGRIINFVVE